MLQRDRSLRAPLNPPLAKRVSDLFENPRNYTATYARALGPLISRLPKVSNYLYIAHLGIESITINSCKKEAL